ncbi:MAG: TetR-like C-terminal domain-containing protein [Firmicutes bacterium]|nr:TetR-like C-terminal domain-containing protein [Bacillota bacterium]
MQKENRRVKMTKALLNESFLKFLEEKPISRITVKEICEDADVNRSTYYVYYSDPYDQLHKIEDTFIREQAVYIDAILQNGEQDDPSFTNVINKLLHYYQERKHMLRVLLGKHGDIHLEYDILAFFADRILSYGSSRRKLPQEQMQDYIYAASGCFGLIIYWIMTDCKEEPGQLARRISDFTRGVRMAHDSR